MDVFIKGEKVCCQIIHKNNKNIYFRFNDELNLIITCSKFVNEQAIKKLIEENEASLFKIYNKTKMKVKKQQFFYYLGNCYTIVFDYNLKDCQIDNNYIYVPSNVYLEKFLKKECKRVFLTEITKCQRCFQRLPEFQLRIRKMKTRWGVCNRKNKIITLNSLLIEKKIEIIDYVIIHEMCHFFEASHGKDFWQLVSLACPKYKNLRKELKE